MTVMKCDTINRFFQERKDKRMRINKEKLRDIMAQKNLTEEIICIRSGIYRKSLQWILDNGFASEEALERIADAVEIKPEEIYLSDYTAYMENTIEFTRDSERATVTLSQGRYKSKILRLAAERPEECEIVAENKDGSLCAHIPVAWVKIIPTQQLTDEQREQRAEAIRRNVLNNVNTRNENEQKSI